MDVKVKDIISIMGELAPECIAESWDNPGLHIGNPEKPVKKILAAVDPIESVAREALDRNADMLITHHPLFFDNIMSLREDRSIGSITALLIRGNIALYCAHTNLDNARGGVNDYLARIFEMEEVKTLEALNGCGYEKIVVFVPEGYEDSVFSAMAEAGAGHIGNYSHCTFRTGGIGTFKPGENTKPFLGQRGELAQAKEYRLETIVPSELTDSVITAMLKAHPYEEAAYDIYALRNYRRDIGPGRIGVLPKAIPLNKFAEKVKKRLGLKQVKCSGNLDRTVKRVALCGGSGSSLIDTAAALKADVFLTGDVKHHDAHKAMGLGIALIDAGHFGTEKIVPDIIKGHIEKYTTERNLIVEVIKSDIDTDPFIIL